MKRRIRLTESDLHRIVKESVNRVLMEVSAFPNKEEKELYQKFANGEITYAQLRKALVKAGCEDVGNWDFQWGD